MSELTFSCPKCGINIEADESVLGQDIECPSCKNIITAVVSHIGPGFELGGFVLQKRLGKGGMGEVWLTHQKSMDRKVALKILSPSLTKNKDFVNRFIREVKTSAKLVHPNIVTAFDAGFEKGIYFLVVEYVEGEELGQKLSREKILPEKEALSIVRGTAEGLAYAWNKFKILHRDIKPSNIMIDIDGNPKIMDMGIAKNLNEDASMTMTGVILGTPCYMSPEQARSEKCIDFRSDIYSLGATLYHLVTGQFPFDGDSTVSIMTKHVVEPLENASRKNPNVSKQCSELLNTMMQKKPDERQQSWEAVLDDVDRVMRGEYPTSCKSIMGFTVPCSLVPYMRHLKILAIMTIGIFLLIVVLAMIMSRGNKELPDQAKETVLEMENKTPVETAAAPAPETVLPVEKQEDKKKVDQPSAQSSSEMSQDIVENEPENAVKSSDAVEESEPPAAPAVISEESLPKKLAEELKEANPGLKLRKGDILLSDGKIKLNLKGANISDISPVRNFPVTHLDISDTGVTGISALKGMPMQVLIISNTNISDISALAGMALKRLEMSKTQVKDLMPLRGMPLKLLAIDGVPTKDLLPIMGLKLEYLSFSPKDLDPMVLRDLHEMASLKYIDTSAKPVEQMTGADDFWRKLHDEMIKNKRIPSGNNNSPPMKNRPIRRPPGR